MRNLVLALLLLCMSNATFSQEPAASPVCVKRGENLSISYPIPLTVSKGERPALTDPSDNGAWMRGGATYRNSHVTVGFNTADKEQKATLSDADAEKVDVSFAKKGDVTGLTVQVWSSASRFRLRSETKIPLIRVIGSSESCPTDQ